MKFGQNPSLGSRDRVQTSFFGQNLKNSKCWCDLENEVKVTKILTLLSFFLIMCLRKFDQNPPIGSGDRVQTMTNTDGIRTKSIIYPKGDIIPEYVKSGWAPFKNLIGLAKFFQQLGMFNKPLLQEKGGTDNLSFSALKFPRYRPCMKALSF